MIIKNYIGKHVDYGRLGKIGYLENQIGFSQLHCIPLKVTKRAWRGSGQEFLGLMVRIDMNGAITAIGRYLVTNDSGEEEYLSRFPPEIEKKADNNLRRIVDPTRKGIIGLVHDAGEVDWLEVGIAKALQSAEKKERTTFRYGPFILASSTDGAAIMLAPVKNVYMHLGGDHYPQIVSYSEDDLNIRMRWYGQYWACTNKLVLRDLYNGNCYAEKGYAFRRIMNLEAAINEEFPVWKRVKKTKSRAS